MTNVVDDDDGNFFFNFSLLLTFYSDDVTVVDSHRHPANSSEFSFTTPSRPTAGTNSHETPNLIGGFLKSHNYSFAANLNLNFHLDYRPFHLLRYKRFGEYFLLAIVPIFTSFRGKFTVLKSGHVLQFSDTPPNEFAVQNMVDPMKSDTHPENLALFSYFGEESPTPVKLSINLREPVEPEQVESRTIYEKVSANGKVINKPRWYSATFKLAGQQKAVVAADFYDDVEVEDDL